MPIAMIVLWRADRLRCVVVSQGDPITHEVQVQRNGEPIAQQTCENLTEAAELAGLLHARFVSGVK